MDDVIYRKDVLDALDITPLEVHDYELAVGVIKDIPSAQSVDAVDVVRCKDCVENDAKYGNEENWCLKFGYTVHDDDFCSYGERETDE